MTVIPNITNIVRQLYLPFCRGSFLSYRRNAGWRVWGARRQPPCHRLLERLLLYVAVPPFPIPVCSTRRAQSHFWRPPHLLPLRDVRSALHLPSVDHWAECECSVGFNRLKTWSFRDNFFCLAFTLMWTVCSVLLQISSSVWKSLEIEVVHYNYRSSFFDIFVSGTSLCTFQLISV